MSANKITLNGNLLIDLTQDTAKESDVAYGKTFHKSNGDIGIGTAVTQGLNLNGAVVEHTVANGTSVNAGDFVELINSGSALSAAGNFGKILYLSSNKILCTRFVGSHEIGFQIRYFENGEWKKGEETLFNVSNIAETTPRHTSVTMLNDTTGMLTYSESYEQMSADGSDEYWILFSIEQTNDKVSVLNSVNVKSSSNTKYPTSTVNRIDDNHFVAMRRNTSESPSNYCLEIYEVLENGWRKIANTNTLGLDNSTIRVVGNEKILWAQRYTSAYWHITILDINNYVMIPEHEYSFTNISATAVGLLQVSDTKFVLTTNSSSLGCIYFSYENGEFTIIKEASDKYYNATFALPNDTFLGYRGGLILVDCNTFEEISKISLPSHSSTYSVALSSSNSFYLWQYEAGYLINVLVENNKLVIDQGTPNRVQPCKSRNYIYGVALESGESNEIIKVSIPNNEV